MLTLTDQTILITGASRGIGAATARIALQAGANVIGSYNRSAGALEKLAADYGSERVYALQVDLAQPGAGPQLWRRALRTAGKIDGLVNNAGIAPATRLDGDYERWQQDWSQVLQVNTQSAADLCREAILYFKPRRGGRIVTVASRAAFRGDSADYLHYAASKGALVALMRSIARAYASDRILAFLIAPGWVNTDMASIIHEPGNEAALAEIPMGEAAPPEEIGNMIVFLLSGLVDHSTGATFDINGASYVR
jgi:NAD(P)-dependent dehydrogenase (short-subunit alcohol dehydrogenase family)